MNNLKEMLSCVEEILKSLVRLFGILKMLVRKYPYFAIVLVLFVCGYMFLRWYVFYYPQECVDNYYKAVGQHNFTRAWGLLQGHFRLRWNNENAFDAGYKTTTPYTEFKIECDYSMLNPYSYLGAASMTYTVECEECERFTGEDIRSKEQQPNSYWLRIAHPNDYDNWLSDTENKYSNTLILNRRFKELVVVERTDSGWLIGNIRREETTLLR